MIARAHVDGLVLAGGRSRRMQTSAGGVLDKGLVSLQGKPLVQWVANYLVPRVNTIYISANRNRSQYSRYGVCVGDDPVLGNDLGPLAGLASVMAVAQRPWLLVLPVDVPRVPHDLFARLSRAVSNGASLAYAQAGQDRHPLCLLVRTCLGDDLRLYLQHGGRRVLDWHRRHDAVPVDFGPDASLFGNINTPDDLRAAEQT